MAEDEDKAPASIPAWQRSPNTESNDDNKPPAQDASPDSANDTQETSASSQDSGPEEDELAVARRFLEDEQVKSSSREKKVSFLRAKGIKDSDIEKLLGSDPTPTEHPSPSSSLSPSDRAPVITYPEFLTSQFPSSQSQSPLVTSTRLLTTLQAAAALSSLVYGTSRFVLSPMLDRLTASRADFHSSVSQNLDTILAKLEATVSVIPPVKASRRDDGGLDDGSSDTDDPSEMFHRDVGTQTTLPVPSVSSAPKPAPHEAQASKLEGVTRRLGDLRDGLRSQSDDLGDVKTLIDVFRDDLDVLTYRSYTESGGYDYLSRLSSSTTAPGKRSDPDDEIRKARDNIRRVKGVLLSTRSFPVSTR